MQVLRRNSETAIPVRDRCAGVRKVPSYNISARRRRVAFFRLDLARGSGGPKNRIYKSKRSGASRRAAVCFQPRRGNFFEIMTILEFLRGVLM